MTRPSHLAPLDALMNHRQCDGETNYYNFGLADSLSIEETAKKLGFSCGEEYLLHLHHNNLSLNPKVPTACDFSKNESANEPIKALETRNGFIICGDSCAYMKHFINEESVDLILTSPPFGLTRKKDYGNTDADLYVNWFEQFAYEFARILKPDGSLVIDIGGAWKKGLPTRSLYHYELLIMLCRKFNFHLAQEFFWWNPAKLPTPAEWVNVRRVRVKDAVNCIWWLSKTPYPKVSNWRVIQPYSKSMKDLLKKGYKPKLRPSGHDISNKFAKNNKGAIPPNLIALANTESNSFYRRYCRQHGLVEHPARFPAGVPALFIRMLTDKGDLVLDPFAGSCATGYVAENTDRSWICCEVDPQYVEGAKGRFLNPDSLSKPDFQVRSHPYEIYPPCFLLDEQEAPLMADGGRNRPKKGPETSI